MSWGERKCLWCGKPFLSKSAGNRKCSACKLVRSEGGKRVCLHEKGQRVIRKSSFQA